MWDTGRIIAKAGFKTTLPESAEAWSTLKARVHGDRRSRSGRKLTSLLEIVATSQLRFCNNF